MSEETITQLATAEPTTSESVLVRGVGDTALWVASFRALETQRPDAIFRDPYAERLAGERGFQIANTLREGNAQDWVWVARTYLCDHYLSRKIAEGADLVLNLAAGLDARPYRMDLPASLRWVEVDLPQIIDYKEEILAREKPKCRLERIRMDLSSRSSRVELFSDLNRQATNIAVLAEGLLIYLAADEVASLARDLSEGSNFHSWAIDLASPMQLKLMQWTMGKQLSEAGAAFKFGPPEGPDFFRPCGWELEELQGLVKTAAQFNRAPAKMLPVPPDPTGAMGKRQWSGVCLFKRIGQP
jgi:methyltransferase (TIGR00027 family)